MRLKNSKGQMTIEAVLLLSIFVAFFTIAQKFIKDQDWFGQLVDGPWILVQGMIENGVWADASTGKSKHPNLFRRRASPEPF